MVKARKVSLVVDSAWLRSIGLAWGQGCLIPVVVALIGVNSGPMTTSGIQIRVSVASRAWLDGGRTEGKSARVTEDWRKKLERGLALFDFDGTLVPWDTQALFADFVLKRDPKRRAYLPVFASLVPCAKILGDEGLKRVFLSYLWRLERDQVEQWAREFAAELVPGMCYGELLRCLEEHKNAGHLTVLASASPEFYIKEVGRILGFDMALGTVVECRDRMKFFPDLINHKGAAKVRRLSEIIGPPSVHGWPGSHGYTDSTADLPMMYCCQHGTLVNPSGRLESIGKAQDWRVFRPQVPWTGKLDKSRQILRFVAGIS